MEVSVFENIRIDYFAILIQFVVASSFVGLTFAFTHIVGPKRKGEVKLQSFECGLEPIGSARLPFSVKYFLAAILFVLFDIEIIFMYPWALTFKDFQASSMGWYALLSMGVFLLVFIFGLFWEVKSKALEWE